MNQYIESVIAKLTGLQGEGGNVGGTGTSGGRHKYPVIKLMDYTKQIMQVCWHGYSLYCRVC